LRAATPEAVAAALRTLLSPVDVDALEQGFGEFLARSMPHAFASGAEGWIDDDLSTLKPWGFDVATIAVPVLIWHGRHDRFVPVTHGEWLARHVGGADVRISADDGHLTLVAERIPAVHEWLMARF
jgi:pimeloyl-ACP methyl ester carboxylesterase